MGHHHAGCPRRSQLEWGGAAGCGLLAGLGALLSLAPALWLVAAIALRRHGRDRYFTDRLIFWSGIGFAVLIFFWSGQVALSARSTLIEVVD